MPYLITALIMLVFLRFIFFTVRIDSNSMAPTLKSGEIKIAYKKRNHNYQRGDILIFHVDEYGTDFVKRLIGLPGEKIDIQNGQVLVNGLPLDEPYVTNNNVYRGSFHVPRDCYFFLGDNRAYSTDSRTLKTPYIAHKNIKGKVMIA